MENLENKKIIIIFSIILWLTLFLFWFTTYIILAEKNKVEAKLEQNKDLISKSERIKVLEKNNLEISEKITELKNQKTLLEENLEKNNWEIKELKNSLVK